MFILRDSITVDLEVMSNILCSIGIGKLHIFYIDNNMDNGVVNTISIDKGCHINCISMNGEKFIEYLNRNSEFLKHNKESLYIVKDGNYLEIKTLFSSINNYPVVIGRGVSQKNHALSPLDFRLSTYLMAMFNFDYKLIGNLNTFYDMDKQRYLSYKQDKPLIRSVAKRLVRYVAW